MFPPLRHAEVRRVGVDGDRGSRVEGFMAPNRWLSVFTGLSKSVPPPDQNMPTKGNDIVDRPLWVAAPIFAQMTAASVERVDVLAVAKMGAPGGVGKPRLILGVGDDRNVVRHQARPVNREAITRPILL